MSLISVSLNAVWGAKTWLLEVLTRLKVLCVSEGSRKDKMFVRGTTKHLKEKSLKNSA